MSDLIRRIDAIQACQVAPSGEWSDARKSGYNQAATDCAMALLKCEPVPPTLSAAMELPEVQALEAKIADLENANSSYQAALSRLGFDGSKGTEE